MRLKNVMIVVNDISRSKKFYKDLFGLEVLLDDASNVILTEGLVLQERKVWESYIGKSAVFNNNASLLYFEERDMEAFIEKLDGYEPAVTYLQKLTVQPWGRKFIRFYDPDGNLIEVGAYR